MAGFIEMSTLLWKTEFDSGKLNMGVKSAENQVNLLKNKTSGLSNFLNKTLLGSVLGVTGGLTGMATAGIKTGLDLQNAMSALQKQTNMSNKEMTGFKDTIVGIYNKNLGGNFEEIANSLALVKQNTNLSNTEVKNMTSNALLLQKTFGYEVNESVRAASSLMRNFGVDGEKAMNLIAQATQNGADKNGDLLDTLNEYAPQFKQLGFNAQDFGNILVTGAQNGAFSIDKVGDAIKEFNLRAKDGSKTTMAAFTQLGLNAQELTSNFAKGGTTAQEAFKKVISALGQVKDPVLQNSIGVALFGTQFEDLGKKAILSFGNINSNINLTKDSLNEINKIKYNNLNEAFEGIKRQLTTGIFLPLSEKILPTLSEFSNNISQSMPQIKSTMESTFNVAGKAVGTLGDGIKFVADNSNLLIPVLAGVAGAMGALKITETVTSMMKAYRESTIITKIAQEGLNAAIKANPLTFWISLIGIAITMGTALYQNWDKISAFGKKMWTDLQGIFGSIGKGISDTWNSVRQKTSETWDNIKSKVLEVGQQTWNNVKTTFGNISTNISTSWDTAKTRTSEAWDAMKNKISQNGGGIKGVIKTAMDGYNNIWKTGFDLMNTATGGKLAVIVTSIKTKMQNIHDIIFGWKDKLAEAWDSIWDLKLPHIKLPHFSISGSFSINPPSTPHFSIDWYDKGGLFKGGNPTIIGVGERRDEFVGALDDLRYLIRDELNKNNFKNSDKNSSQSQIFQIDKLELYTDITNTSGVDNLIYNFKQLPRLAIQKA